MVLFERVIAEAVIRPLLPFVDFLDSISFTLQSGLMASRTSAKAVVGGTMLERLVESTVLISHSRLS
jgi:hypothetical protein